MTLTPVSLSPLHPFSPSRSLPVVVRGCSLGDFLNYISFLLIAGIVRDIGLRDDPAACAGFVHNYDSPDLTFFHQIAAVFERRIPCHRNDRCRHGILRRQVERVLTVCNDPTCDITIGDHSDRHFRSLVIDDRDAPAVVVDHHLCNFLETRVRRAARGTFSHDLFDIHYYLLLSF